VYKHNAAATFHVHYDDVDKEQRQIGKVQELACGFAGGVGAFASMGRIYNVILTESDSRKMVDGWRRANPWSVNYWTALERAYTGAMRHPGKEISAGRVTYLYDKQHLWYALPSGRVLCYPFARFDEEGNITYAKAAWKPAADAKEWPRARLWRGLACENITQAIANDLLRHALRRLADEGFDVVLHVHDEIVLETDASTAEDAAAALVKIMCTPPLWAAGLPLNAEVAIMQRYGK
jgi:DNA polymerase bacteriophage-type